MSAPFHNPNMLKAVILVGDLDFGRCSLASRLNRALWPVFGKPALQVLLEQLDEQNIKRIVVSCQSQSQEIQKAVCCPPELDIVFQEKTLPRGPAGCIRDAAEPEDESLLVLPGNMLLLPPIQELLQKHHQTRADMTIFLNPCNGRDRTQVDSQIYICRQTILKCIPETGYFDLKEGFIPAAIQADLSINAADLSVDTGHYRGWGDYIAKLKNILAHSPDRDRLLKDFSPIADRPGLWVGSGVHLSNTAKFFGPVVIGDHSTITDGAMVFGPAVIGNKVKIAPNSLIEESVLWDQIVIGPGSRVRNDLLDYKTSVPQNAEISGRLVPSPQSKLQKAINAYRQASISKIIEKSFRSVQDSTQIQTLTQIFQKHQQKCVGIFLAFLLLGALIVSYWKPTLRSLVGIWLESDEYSSGLLVPMIAVYVLWLRRKSLGRIVVQPSLMGLGLLFAAQGIRFFGLYFMFASAERLSLVLSVGAVVWFLFGGQFFKKITPIFLFLFLMLPLPNRVENALTIPLQAWATVSSVFCLETLGFSVVREGNIININGTLVAVAEACNGLRMLTAFVVVSGLVALVINRSRPVKVLILLSSIPIALACNTLRLTITAIAFTKLDTERWEKVFHDFGGFAMMPVAILLIVLELWLLSRLLITPKNKQKQVIYRKKVIESSQRVK